MLSTVPVQSNTRELLPRAEGALHDVLARPMPSGSEAALKALRPPEGSHVVYVSTPITTGPAYLDWLIEHRDAPESDRERARQVMIRSNVANVVPLVKAVPRLIPGAHIIDPTALEDMSGWAQADYHRFWAEVIAMYVDEIVFADGWTASVGCTVEFAVAMLEHLPARRSDFSVITVGDGMSELRAMSRRIHAAGASIEMHSAVFATIERSQR